MRAPWIQICAIALLALWLGSEAAAQRPLYTGDLVIAALQGEERDGDDRAQYIAIYNPTASAIPLDSLDLIARIDSPSRGDYNVVWALMADMKGRVIPPRGTFVIGEAGALGRPDVVTPVDLPFHEAKSTGGALTVELRLNGIHMDVVLYRDEMTFKPAARSAKLTPRKPAPPPVVPPTVVEPPIAVPEPPKPPRPDVARCDEDQDCVDERFCNGTERCEGGVCVSGEMPCQSLEHCDEEQASCLECIEADNGKACHTGSKGVCAEGTIRCAAGKYHCQFEVVPSEELCDGIDNDCDGIIDEGLQGTGAPCFVGRGECSAPGVIACSADGSGLECVGTAGEPSPEICDLLDNDCDGEVDEANPQGGAHCDAGGLGVCRRGIVSCEAGMLLCATAVRPAPDDSVCNNLDDDCDGRIDEDFVSAPTTCGSEDCEAVGRTICTQGQVQDTCEPLGNCELSTLRSQ